MREEKKEGAQDIKGTDLQRDKRIVISAFLTVSEWWPT